MSIPQRESVLRWNEEMRRPRTPWSRWDGGIHYKNCDKRRNIEDKKGSRVVQLVRICWQPIQRGRRFESAHGCNYLPLKQTIMKEFFKIMEKDIMREKFTRKEVIIYGTVYPLALIIIMYIAGWLETL